MFSSPGTPRRPQTATERLTNVRSNLHTLREAVDSGESFSLAHLASSHSRGGNSKATKIAAPPRQHEEGRKPVVPNPSASMCADSAPSAASLQSFEDAILTMKQHAIKIEEHLAVEATARQDSDRKLKHLIEQRVKESVSLLEKRSSEKISELQLHVDSMSRCFEKLQGELATEREKNVRLTQELKYQATQGVAEVRDHVAQVRNATHSSQSILIKNLMENMVRLQEKLDVERHTRENMLRTVKDEIDHAGKVREKQDDRVLQKLRDDIAVLEIQLKCEKETREKSEEQLATTMEDVVGQIQLGLRNIAR